MGVLLVMTWRGYKKALLAENDLNSGLMMGAFAMLVGFLASSLVNDNFGDSEVLLMILSVVALAVVANGQIESRIQELKQT